MKVESKMTLNIHVPENINSPEFLKSFTLKIKNVHQYFSHFRKAVRFNFAFGYDTGIDKQKLFWLLKDCTSYLRVVFSMQILILMPKQFLA